MAIMYISSSWPDRFPEYFLKTTYLATSLIALITHRLKFLVFYLIFLYSISLHCFSVNVAPVYGVHEELFNVLNFITSIMVVSSLVQVHEK
jgi:hypothetical protein